MIELAVAATVVGLGLVVYVGYYCRVILVYAVRALSAALTIVRSSVFFTERPLPPQLSSIDMAHPVRASLQFMAWLVQLALQLPSLTLVVLWRILQVTPDVSFARHNDRDSSTSSHDTVSSHQRPKEPRPCKSPTVKCMDCAKLTDSTIHCAKCRYFTCTPCFVSHAAECINNDQVSFVCVRCYQEIDASVLNTHLPPPLLSKMERFKALDTLTSCPSCNGRLKQSGMSRRRMACGGCGAVWCFKCRQPYHMRSSCRPTN